MSQVIFIVYCIATSNEADIDIANIFDKLIQLLKLTNHVLAARKPN